MNRRKFIENSVITTSSLMISSNSLVALNNNGKKQNALPGEPFAINMWDYTWLLRSYKGGSMENWDKILDELQERGYNALRLDCFPQFIAKGKNGEIHEDIYFPKNSWHVALWGNEFSVTLNPRKAVPIFFKKCKDRNIKIGLSSWFLNHGTKLTQHFAGEDGLVRAWNETLEFLSERDLLSNVIYVDLLNEYPLWHGYTWLHKKLEENKEHKAQNVSGKGYDFLNKNGRRFNNSQVQLYNNFIKNVIVKLKANWPQLKFMASQTNTLNTPWQDLDVKSFEVLDIHLWMIYNKKFSETTGYFEKIHSLRNDREFKIAHQNMMRYWQKHKQNLYNWMDAQILKRKTLADKMNVPLGNTEGWGAVMWMDHPNLSWDFIKQCGIIGAELGKKHNFSFNCTSNFNHPHFKLWNDIEWHKKVTSIIKDV